MGLFKTNTFNSLGEWLSVVEHAPIAITIVDESNTIKWMNAMAYTLFKVSTEQQTEELTWDSLLFSLGPDGTVPSDLLLASQAVTEMGPFKAFVTDESNTRVEVMVRKVQFGGKDYACCYLSSDTKEEDVLKCSLDAVIQADLDKNIIGWNSAAENTFGYAEKDITGKPLSTIFPRRDSRGESDIYEFLLNHKSVNRIVGVTGHRKDGKEIPLEMAVSALNYANGKKYFSFFIRDLSQIKYIEQLKGVEEASQAKSVFVSSISHELRSPLNTIFGFGQLLTEMPLTSEQLEYVHGIINASEALIQLVSDMADLSKIEAHKIDLESVPFSVATVVNDVINSGLVMARSKQIEVASFVTYDCPCKVIGDPRRLKQVLVNLVNNGIKFTETGSVVVSVEVKKEEPNCCEFLFNVSDTGLGIAQEDVGKLFKRFSQLNSQRYGGSGLGLAISAELVRLMGGEIGVFSGGRGKGSTLWFSCKFEIPPIALAIQPLPRSPNPFEAVVVYRYDCVGAKLAKYIAQSYNIDEVPLMASMDELIQYISTNVPAAGKQVVLLVDEELPEFNEKFKLVKEKAHPEHHFIIVRGSSDKHQPEGARKGDLVVLKPLNQAKLRATLDPFSLLVEMISNGIVCANPECIAAARDGPPKAKILVAEDNTLNFLITQKMLSSAGYECHQATNGYEVLQLLSRGQYGLVLMDCMMPRLDGYATTKMIRECCTVPTPANVGDTDDVPRPAPPPPTRARRPSIATIPHGIPVVAMTANAMRGDREKCLSVGMDDYISKPFQKQQLLDIVQKWIPKQ